MDLPLPRTHLVFSNTEWKARKIGFLLLRAEEVFHFYWKASEQQPNRRKNEILLDLSSKRTCLCQSTERQGYWYMTRNRISFEKHFEVFQSWWGKGIQASLQCALRKKIIGIVLLDTSGDLDEGYLQPYKKECILNKTYTSYKNLFSYCHVLKPLPQPQNHRTIRKRVGLLTTP